MTDADTAARIAHLLRRTSFGPLPGQVDELLPLGYEGALEQALTASPQPPFPPPATDDELADTWMSWMRRPQAGLHEKLTWFWHGHLTTDSSEANDPALVYRQHLLMRRHATGNVGELLRRIAVDGAMLRYLDGDGSTADDPNENFSRELLELFTLGRGMYSQGDVRAGAVALAGWSVSVGGEVSFDRDAALAGTVVYLGRQGVRGVDDVVDAVLAHGACAPFIASRVHRFLVGSEPATGRRAELGAVLRAGGYEVRPLVEAILRHPSFEASRLMRPRFPVEWVTAATAALDVDTGADLADAMGQRPYAPPNVAGWPPGSRWLSATAVLARSDIAIGPRAVDEVASSDDVVTAAFHRCSVYDVTAPTRAAVSAAAASRSDAGQRARLALGLAVLSPEFALA